MRVYGPKEVDQPEAIKWGGLNNAQLLKVYFSMKQQQEIIEANLAKNKVLRIVENKSSGLIDFRMVNIPSESVEQFKETEYYKLIGSVVETLAPIVSLLVDCDDALKALSHELR
jgi:hypothetical protein